MGLREQRMTRTRRELARTARRLTIERGLAGFTIDELCEIVGVSRRTFFNYFPSKEDAVVGHAADGLDDEALEFFVAMRPRVDGISPNLLDDLAAVAIASVGPEFEESPDGGLDDPGAVVAREPQLLARFTTAGAEVEARLVNAVERREGLLPGDPVARTAVLLIGTLIRDAAERRLRHETASFADALLDSVADAKRLLQPER